MLFCASLRLHLGRFGLFCVVLVRFGSFWVSLDLLLCCFGLLRVSLGLLLGRFGLFSVVLVRFGLFWVSLCLL